MYYNVYYYNKIRDDDDDDDDNTPNYTLESHAVDWSDTMDDYYKIYIAASVVSRACRHLS